MTDYTPTTREVLSVYISAHEEGVGRCEGLASRRAKFDRWFTGELDKARADERERIAAAIWAEEQRVIHAMLHDPTDSHYNGILRGLQRSRDLVAARGEGQ